VKDITPKHLRCTFGTCPAVYDITPEHLQCEIMVSCPSVGTFEDGKKLLIVGKKPDPAYLETLAVRIGEDEQAIVIDAEYFANVPR
jgi:hypothetical protein